MHESHFGAVRKVRASQFDCRVMFRVHALAFTVFLVLSAQVFGQDDLPPPPPHLKAKL
jgi:hypothetical protein